MPSRIGPMPVVDPATVASLPRPFSACARCGYLGLRALTHEDGMIAGGNETLNPRVCTRCHHEGPPVLFDAPEEYTRFLQGLQDRL